MIIRRIRLQNTPRARLTAVLSAALLLLLTACDIQRRPEMAQPLPVADFEGNPERGADLIDSYGCSSCHSVPGVRGADALVGPPLDAWAQRHTIAGSLPNTPDNLILWIRRPQEVEPGTIMPNMGVTERDARDIAA
ncbi:MAG: c-type cytochrome, partial [bacterium]